MTDILIRDVPDDIVAALDARAARLGLSRNELLRRQIGQEIRCTSPPVTADDLRRSALLAQDLDDPDVMANAWS